MKTTIYSVLQVIKPLYIVVVTYIPVTKGGIFMKMYFSNNSRKLHKKPMNRKKDKRKRFYTRKETVEAIDEFFDALNRR